MSKLRQERRSLWESIPNLHIVGECIEKVRIHCRRAVIVMVHCHLSFQQEPEAEITFRYRCN